MGITLSNRRVVEIWSILCHFSHFLSKIRVLLVNNFIIQLRTVKQERRMGYIYLVTFSYRVVDTVQLVSLGI